MAERFTFVADETGAIRDGGFKAYGYVYGSVNIGDRVYIIRPDGDITETNVNSITLDDGKSCHMAKQQMAMLHFTSLHSYTQIPKLSVVTSIKPCNGTDGPLENPYLMGLTVETLVNHLKTSKDDFPDKFIAAVNRSSFLVPIILHGEWSDKSDPDFSFPVVDAVSEKAIPIFTDNAAFQLAVDAAGKDFYTTVVLSEFKDLIEARGNNHLVINPFGPVEVLLEDKGK